jgi:hypothetical protein
MKREFLDRTNNYTLAGISGASLRLRMVRSGVARFLQGNRNRGGGIVLKYAVMNHP